MTVFRGAATAALSVFTAGFLAVAAMAQAQSGPSPQQRAEAIAAKSGGAIEARVIGRSAKGEAIPMLRIAGAGAVDPDSRPALLVVAGVSGMHVVGTDVAFGLAQALGERAGAALADATVYVVPVVNVDAQRLVRSGGKPARFIDRTLTPDDADHDGRIDEDGPKDLNGDGVITMMRLFDPPPGIKATLMADPDEPRLLRPAKPEKAERNRYAVFVEGLDADGDGAIAEDGAGGVDLNLNFPARWPEFHDGAGVYQLDQPESRALAEWMLSRPNIAAVLVFGPHDNLASEQREGQYDQTGRVPKQLERGDKGYHDEIVKVFKEITGISKAPSRNFDGSLALWSYTHFGAPTFATPVWVRPDLIKRGGEPASANQGESDDREPSQEGEERVGGMTIAQMRAMVQAFESASEAEQQAMMQRFRTLPPAAQQRMMRMAQGEDAGGGADSAPRGGRSGGGARANSDTDDAKWLKYSDEKRGGAGFVDWKPFEHPTLGAVEIGGFVPGFRLNPPAEELPRLIHEQTRFAQALVERLPRLRVGEPYVERVGDRLWRVVARVVNEGYLPTISAMGVKTRRLTPIVMQLDPRGARLLAGEPQQRQASVEGSGGEARSQWLVAGPEGSSVEVSIRSSAIGETTIRIPLRDAASGKESP